MYRRLIFSVIIDCLPSREDPLFPLWNRNKFKFMSICKHLSKFYKGILDLNLHLADNQKLLCGKHGKLLSFILIAVNNASCFMYDLLMADRSGQVSLQGSGQNI